MSALVSRVAELTANGIYEPGQYARQGGLEAGPVTENPDGSVCFLVWSCAPNTDRERVMVTISPD